MVRKPGGRSDGRVFWGIGISTLDNWKRDKPEFLGALKAGKELSDSAVERSLSQRALGYSHPAVKILQYEGRPIEVPYIEHYRTYYKWDCGLTVRDWRYAVICARTTSPCVSMTPTTTSSTPAATPGPPHRCSPGPRFDHSKSMGRGVMSSGGWYWAW